jgi:hypothetical protein
MMIKAKTAGQLGEFPYSEATLTVAYTVLFESAIYARRKIRNEIHHITHETERSLEIVDITKRRDYPKVAVQTDAAHAIKLEFHLSPFMRPGARKARRGIREIVKRVSGGTFKAATKLRKQKYATQRAWLKLKENAAKRRAKAR